MGQHLRSSAAITLAEPSRVVPNVGATINHRQHAVSLASNIDNPTAHTRIPAAADDVKSSVDRVTFAARRAPSHAYLMASIT